MSSSYRGQVLAGRYRLEERLHSSPDGVTWRAVDSTLDRRVSIRVMPPGHPFAADVADAARRAALIDDTRLVRVLDVGTDDDCGYVVSEYLDGDTLAALVERSPLSAPAVRRIIGEVAQGLDLAAGRGLHHLRLTPRSVMVGRDGSVKISGTAVEAAAAGLEPDHAGTASRVDAVSLVALLYSGLTGRWPLGDAGFPPAPRGEGGAPVPPADLVPGVPNDLDTLCVVTLGPHDDGPRTPADLVQQLLPWPSATEAPLRAAPRRFPSEAAPATPNPALTMRGPSSASRRPATAAPRLPPAVFAPKAGAGGTSGPAPRNPAAGASGHQADQPPAIPPRRSASLFPTPSVAATGSMPMPPRRDDRRTDSLFTDHPPAPANPENPQSGSRAPAAPIHPAFGRDSRQDAREPLVPWGPGWTNEPTTSRPAPAGPFPILIPSEAPPREQSRMVLVSIVAVLALVLAVAAFSLRNFGSSSNSDNVASSSGTSPLPTATAADTGSAATATDQSEPSATPSVTPTTTSAVPVRAGDIQAIDPQGDGDEDSASAPRALDGDATTFWRSSTYQSAQFGGLKKGVGLAVKLKKPGTVTSVSLDILGDGGTVELRTADRPDLDTSTVVGEGTFKNGQLTIQADGATESKYVILWFTKLPSVDGKYKAEVTEVRLK